MDASVVPAEPWARLGGKLARVACGAAAIVALLTPLPPARADLLKIPVAEEIAFGLKASRAFEAQHRLLGGPVLTRIEHIGQRVAQQAGRPDIPFSFHVVDDPNINAITFPGGYIYVYRGLMDCEPTDDELAAVLGHECAHAAKSHTYKELVPISVLRRLGERVTGQRDLGAAEPVSKVLELLGQRGLSRRFEFEADSLGAQYAARAGYDPKGMLGVLEFFAKMERSRPTLVEGLLHTHPPAAVRLARVRPVVARLHR